MGDESHRPSCIRYFSWYTERNRTVGLLLRRVTFQARNQRFVDSLVDTPLEISGSAFPAWRRRHASLMILTYDRKYSKWYWPEHVQVRPKLFVHQHRLPEGSLRLCGATSRGRADKRRVIRLTFIHAVLKNTPHSTRDRSTRNIIRFPFGKDILASLP